MVQILKVDPVITIQGVIRLFDAMIKPLKTKQDSNLEKLLQEKFFDLLGFTLLWSIGSNCESDQR